MKQKFNVYIVVECDIEKPLSESRVKMQIQKFLRDRSLTEGIAHHGTGTMNVTEVIELVVK